MYQCLLSSKKVKEALTQHEIVSLLTGPCGFTVLTNNFEELPEMSRLTLSVDIYSYTTVCTVNKLMSITQQFNQTVTIP